MPSLVEVLKDESKRQAVAKDGAVLVDEEVAAKRGIRAAVLKAGYASVKAIKPGIVEEAMYTLLPRFAPAIDPHWEKAVATGDPHRYFRERAGEIAESLLGVTDERLGHAKNRVMISVYKSLRPTAVAYTTESVPRLSGLIQKHV
jgi:hypothetical protein